MSVLSISSTKVGLPVAAGHRDADGQAPIRLALDDAQYIGHHLHHRQDHQFGHILDVTERGTGLHRLQERSAHHLDRAGRGEDVLSGGGQGQRLAQSGRCTAHGPAEEQSVHRQTAEQREDLRVVTEQGDLTDGQAGGGVGVLTIQFERILELGLGVLDGREVGYLAAQCRDEDVEALVGQSLCGGDVLVAGSGRTLVTARDEGDGEECCQGRAQQSGRSHTFDGCLHGPHEVVSSQIRSVTGHTPVRASGALR
jgi:hypothetical protein